MEFLIVWTDKKHNTQYCGEFILRHALVKFKELLEEFKIDKKNIRVFKIEKEMDISINPISLIY